MLRKDPPPQNPIKTKQNLKLENMQEDKFWGFFIPQIKEIVKNSKNLMSISDAYFWASLML